MNDGDDALADISKLLLNNMIVGATSAAPPGVPPPPGDINGGSSAAADKPILNILNQASNITQLNANNTSFDPSQVVMAGQAAAATIILADPHQQQSMIPSFLIQQPSISNNSSPQPQLQLPSAMVMQNHQLPSQIPAQPAPVAHVHHQLNIQQQLPVVQSVGDAALFGQNNAASLAQNSIVATSSIGGGMPPQPMQQMQQVVPQMQQQQPLQPQQVMQQPMQPGGYQEKTDYNVYSDSNKAFMNGRVPATRRDGRKLFVGGLPNGVTDLSFLQFFQQYGEVIDSVVLVDRNSKRSRGFGFVTFADANVAASLLTTIPGRTGMVNILGKNCEVKASEPKTAEAAHLAHSTINLPIPPHHHPNNPHQHHPPPPPPRSRGWNHMPHQQQQQMIFGAGGIGGGGAAIHPLPVNQTMPVPPNFNYHGGRGGAISPTGGGGGVPIYSHSTITRTTAGVPPSIVSSADDSASPTNVYIQNNFYTLPPGTDLPPSHTLSATPTPEALVQAQQTELIQNGGAVAAAALGQTMATAAGAPYTTAYACSALQPLYPGTNNGGEMDNTGGQRQLQHHQQQQQQQINARGHLPYT